VARFNIWFHVYNHWFLKLFWLGLLSALILEVVFFVQAITVGRAEYLPNGTQAQWTALVIAGAAAFVIVWEYMKVVWNDPLYQAVPAITLFLLPLATTALLLRRRSAVAQSPVIYGCFCRNGGALVGRYGRLLRRRLWKLAIPAHRCRRVRDVVRRHRSRRADADECEKRVPASV
jgi:hypothetical protein